MIVHDDDIEPKTGLLSDGTLHGVGNGAASVAYGDDDRGSYGKSVFIGFGQFVYFVGSQPGTYLFEVGRTDALTLQLGFASSRIDIVKLSFATLAKIGLGLGVEQFAQMENIALAAQAQPHGIGCCITVAGIAFVFNKTLEPL